MTIIKALGILLVVTLSACGGDGGSGTPNTTPPPASTGTVPTITAQPASVRIAVGATATFSVTATGTAPLSYQWLRGGTAISGATAASYTTPAVVSADTGATFTVKVSNSAGSVTSSAASITVTATATTGAPQITVQPTSVTVAAGATASFSVTAGGTAPLTYQWYRNGVAIAGTTAASYTTNPVIATDTGTIYTVKVTNSLGSVTSSGATLTVGSGSTSTGTSDITTYKYDALRSGLNATESVLTTTNVKSATFGLLRKLAVDGKVDGQPLYLSQLTVGGAVHNVLIAVTEHDSVYAFDADTGAKLWQVSMLAAGESTASAATLGCSQVTPELGITATPVIDRGAGHGTLYLVAMSKDSGGNYHQRLHALDVTTGAAAATTAEIGATNVMQNGASNTFDPEQYEERASLLLNNGYIYVSFTSHCDHPPYSGWVMAYKQSDLSQAGLINLGPNSTGGGPAIWMSGAGLAADAAGSIYLITANGAFETSLNASGFPNGGDYGNAFVRLTNNNGTFAVADYFAVKNTISASAADQDLGSGGVLLLPDQTVSGATKHLALGGGKDGNLYVVDRDNMGKFSASANNIWQTVSLGSGLFSSPAYFNNMVFVGPVSGPVKQYKLAAGMLTAGATTTSTPSFTWPGTAISVSANGTAQGIVWAHENATPPVLHAYSATDLTELYNSSQAASNRDQFATAGNKFITPVVANGKVFVATINSVAVFGLLN